MTTTIKTKSGWVEVSHRNDVPQHEIGRLERMTVEEIFQVPWVRGVRMED